jgi:hypothetical protein
VPTFAAARELKVRRRAEAAARRRGPTVHAYALEWVDRYAGRGGHDFINDRTRREYRRLLITYAFEYFDADDRLSDIDEHRAQAFVDWLCRQPGPDGTRLSDCSIHNAVLPLRACLHHAAAAGVLASAPDALVLPRRRGGRPYAFDERRFLTREQLARLLAEVPDDWRPLFELLASRRAIVAGQVGSPKSRHGRRSIPISDGLAGRLALLAAGRDGSELLFRGARGAALRPGNLRYRVLIPAAGAPAFLGRASIRCATPARPCSSRRARARCGCSAGWVTTRPPSRSTTTGTSSTASSARRST